jgi:molybdopterin converting factor small subunit
MRVKFLGRLRKLAGADELAVSAENVAGLLTKLRAMLGVGFERVYNPRRGRLAHDVHVLVNGRNIALLQETATRLAGDDVVVIFEVMAGG